MSSSLVVTVSSTLSSLATSVPTTVLNGTIPEMDDAGPAPSPTPQTQVQPQQQFQYILVPMVLILLLILAILFLRYQGWCAWKCFRPKITRASEAMEIKKLPDSFSGKELRRVESGGLHLGTTGGQGALNSSSGPSSSSTAQTPMENDEISVVSESAIPPPKSIRQIVRISQLFSKPSSSSLVSNQSMVSSEDGTENQETLFTPGSLESNAIVYAGTPPDYNSPMHTTITTNLES